MNARTDTRPASRHHPAASQVRPDGGADGPGWRAFHTPVRGHRFAVPPVGGATVASGRLRLRAEPDNPADPYAVAVWAEGGGRPWRTGYLERAVAIRLVQRADDVTAASVRFAGWWEEPGGRWQRPVVQIAPPGDDAGRPPVTGLRALPPCSARRRGGRVSDARPPGR